MCRIAVCVVVVLIHLPEDTAALDTPVVRSCRPLLVNATQSHMLTLWPFLQCGDHDESCHKLSEIVSEQARQLKDKDQQLQEHHRTMEGTARQLRDKDRTISAQSHSLELAQLALDEHKRRHRRKLKQMRRKLKKHLVNQGRKSSSQLGEASGELEN